MRFPMVMVLLGLVLGIVGMVSLIARVACAQEVSADLADIAHVGPGDRVPFEGWLVHEPMLLRFRSEIESLRHRLEVDVQLQVDRTAVLVGVEQARTHAAEERLTLHDELWTSREAQLVAELVEARARVVREWWEAPALWFVVGVVVAGALVVAVVGLAN